MTAQCGEIVTWNVRDVFVARGDVIDALEANDIMGLKVPYSEPSTFLRRAIKQCADDGVIRKIGEDGDVVSFAIVDEDTDLVTSSWTGSMREAITLRKTTGEVTFKYDSELSVRILEAYTQQSLAMTSHEVFNTIKRVVIAVCNGTALRPHGGVYFVPSDKCDVLNRLEEAFRSVVDARGNGKARVSINRFAVVTEPRSVADLCSIFSERTALDVDGIGAECIDAIDSEGGVRGKSRPTRLSFNNRIAAVGQMFEKVKSYERALGQSLGSIKGKLAYAYETIQACLDVHLDEAAEHKARRRSRRKNS